MSTSVREALEKLEEFYAFPCPIPEWRNGLVAAKDALVAAIREEEREIERGDRALLLVRKALCDDIHNTENLVEMATTLRARLAALTEAGKRVVAAHRNVPGLVGRGQLLSEALLPLDQSLNAFSKLLEET